MGLGVALGIKYFNVIVIVRRWLVKRCFGGYLIFFFFLWIWKLSFRVGRELFRL